LQNLVEECVYPGSDVGTLCMQLCIQLCMWLTLTLSGPCLNALLLVWM